MPSINLARERSLYTAFTDHAIQARQREMGKLQEHLSTGLKINRASDDAGAFTQARQLDTLSNRFAQYQRSIGGSQAWVNQTQDALDNMAELFSDAYTEGLRFKNDSVDDGNRGVGADRIASLLEEVVDQLNTRSGDEYLFAGSRTTLKPFDLAAGAVTYNGNADARNRPIGRDLSLDINIDGERLHDPGQGFTITESLTSLADALRSGDLAAMETALTQVQTSRDHLLTLGSEAGTTSNRLQLADAHLRDATLSLESRRSQLEDTDYAQAASEFQRAQTGFQAAIRVSANVLQTSILDYLR